MSDNINQEHLLTRYNSASWIVTVLGVLLGSLGIAYVSTHPEPAVLWATEFALIFVPAAAIVYGGYWITVHQIPRGSMWSIAKWCVAGSTFAALLIFGYITVELIGGETIINSELLVILGALAGGVVSLFAAISNEKRHLDIPISTDINNQLVDRSPKPFSADAQILAELAVDTRSWYLIHVLQLAQKPLGVETLAEQIASLEDSNTQDEYIDLIHTRLPKLSDKGLIDYNSDVEIVRLSEGIEAVAKASQEFTQAGEKLASIEREYT